VPQTPIQSIKGHWRKALSKRERRSEQKRFWGRQSGRRSAAVSRDQANNLPGWRRQLDHYLAAARAAAAEGDKIEAENCYQHAEHYFRLIEESAA
jgi:hypothetical protein